MYTSVTSHASNVLPEVGDGVIKACSKNWRTWCAISFNAFNVLIYMNHSTHLVML